MSDLLGHAVKASNPIDILPIESRPTLNHDSYNDVDRHQSELF